jgi:pyridoxine 5-phosphate synthase
MRSSVPRLGVNIDHVATLRNARGGGVPDPLHAAQVAIEAGADRITAHLREDRRHIRDDDIARLKAHISKPLNFEMAATEEMVEIALKTQPHAACLVPERREERTTEGGLDVVAGHDRLREITHRLVKSGIIVSLFIEPDTRAIEAARSIGAPAVELHTGAWCNAVADADQAKAEFVRLKEAAEKAGALGLECHAGHGLDYETARQISVLPQIVELNIGHFLIADAIFIGLAAAIKKMHAAMAAGRGEALVL